MGEYVLDQAGLRQLASMPTGGKPDPEEIQCVNERGLVLLADAVGEAVRACRREQFESNWQVSPIARNPPNNRISIFSWCSLGTSRLALWDFESKAVLYYEYA